MEILLTLALLYGLCIHLPYWMVREWLWPRRNGNSL